jgi:hypothetical protein
MFSASYRMQYCIWRCNDSIGGQVGGGGWMVSLMFADLHSHSRLHLPVLLDKPVSRAMHWPPILPRPATCLLTPFPQSGTCPGKVFLDCWAVAAQTGAAWSNHCMQCSLCTGNALMPPLLSSCSAGSIHWQCLLLQAWVVMPLMFEVFPCCYK